MNSKTFCPLPFIHLATRPNGDIRLCCTSNASGAGIEDNKELGLVKDNGVRMNLREHTVEEVWNSQQMRDTRLQMLNNEIPASCRKCFEEESKGIASKRVWETEVWKDRIDIEKYVDRMDADGNLPVDIPYFDLRLGNICQLKCVMCSPHDSSSWVKDWKKQYPKYELIELKQDQGWDPKFDYTWYQKSSFLESMKDQAQNIKELYFAGGEPLIIPEHYKILEFMIEKGYSQNCVLRYNSNGLDLSSELFVLWNEFKHVKFNFSVDAYEEKNDYIRYPSQWKTVENNLRILDDSGDNITVNIACAVQALNVLYLDELADWKINQNFKKINIKNGAGLIGSHLVYFPSYLNVRVLPPTLKIKAESRINDFIRSMKNDKTFNSDPFGKTRWLGLIDYMKAESWTHKLPAMIEYLEACDATRNTDFRSTFPDLKDL